VVDDNASNRDLLFRRLSHDGHHVTRAESGRRALEILGVEEFDVVLLDLMMPDLNGFQVLERLKADERLHNVPVIMISGLQEVDSVIRCIEAGAADYLSKPFNPVLLRARISACLERKGWRDLRSGAARPSTNGPRCAVGLRLRTRRKLAAVGADDALATASALEQQRVSIADALTVSLLSAAARWARRENADGEGSKEEQPRG
jgi:DNA-binding response OmpR family regulator